MPNMLPKRRRPPAGPPSEHPPATAPLPLSAQRRLAPPRPWIYLTAFALAGLGAMLAAPLLSHYYGEWRRPLIAWMVQNNLVGSWLWTVVHGINLRDVVIGLLAGWLIGWCSFHHWRRFTLYFAVAFIIVRTVAWHFNGFLEYKVHLHGPRWLINIPLQLAMLLPAALLAAWCGSQPQRRLRENRRALGHCAQCGYDLRGTQTPRCPECGAVGVL